jgi:hypothetical protein
MYLDRKIWFTMLVVCIISMGLMGYSYISKQRCVTYNIIARGTLAGGKNITGEPIFFSISPSNGEEIIWNFGDRTGNETKISYSVAKHTYTKEGVYNVSAKSKMVCSNVEIKVIVSKAVKPEGKKIQIVGPVTLQVGQRVTYYTPEVDCKDFEWKILDKGFPIIHKQFANYAFQTPGLYRLQLTLDNNLNKTSVIDIHVREGNSKVPPPAPPTVYIPRIRPTPAPRLQQLQEKNHPANNENVDVKPQAKIVEPVVEMKKHTKIGNRSFQKMLEDVINGEKQLEDFDEFLSLRGKTPVTITGEKQNKKFYQIINQIMGKRKYTVSDVELIKDPMDETIIKSINLTLQDNRSFLKKVWERNRLNK